jgi:hypothetical protein
MMDTSSTASLQKPRRIDPLYLKNLLDAKLQALEIREVEGGDRLAMDLEFVYSQAIAAILDINQLLEAGDDLEEQAVIISKIENTITDLNHHIRSSTGLLHQLEEHIYRMAEALERKTTMAED